MQADRVRSSFLEFFAARHHERVHSASVVPSDDPTLLFTNAGMVPFKDVFTGNESRPYSRATSSQRCVRAGGKHNDLDQVGKTARHHTFFEMLGNFSFGDYFKEDAIAWAWELLTGVWQLDPSRLVITVHRGDEVMGLGPDREARAIWRRVSGLGDDRILDMSSKDNFWMMGETGPMGPCSEIHYYIHGTPRAMPPAAGPESAWEGWVELWNLVFMQYERKVAGGALEPLPAPSIDTGAGLERVTAAVQGVVSNYETDLFTPLLSLAAELAGTRYGSDPQADTSMRVIADHARATAFLVADGVFPDKNERNYVLRRIFRRAVRHGHMLGIGEPFMHEVCAKVIDMMKGAYPELAERASTIREIATEEEKRFRATLERGIHLLDEEFLRMERAGEQVVPGARVFQLYDTFGFPADLTEIIAQEHNYAVDNEGFETALAGARERSSFQSSDVAVETLYKQLADELGPTGFLGYDVDEGSGTLLAIVHEGRRVNDAPRGAQIAFITDKTPFYGESGGQMGDTGVITTAAGATIRIDDTKKPFGDMVVHLGEVTEGRVAVTDEVRFTIDSPRRQLIRANHSATHLLHLALKRYLGDHVAQKGSLVAPDRLRFDFAHFNPLTDEQKRQVEDWVNREVFANLDTTTEVLSIEEAKKRGAVAMFGEKYGATVRVVGIGGESLELCGGTHVRRTGDIGLFKIVSEAGVAQGVRRIEAVTGPGAVQYLRRLEDELTTVGTQLRVAPMEVATRVEKMTAELRRLEKEVQSLKGKLASGGARDLMSEVKDIGGVKVLAASTEVDDPKALRDTGDSLRDRLGSGVVFLAGIGDGKVSMVAMVSKDLTKRFHAGKLLQAAAEKVGGRGGGRPDMAQGGGKDPAKVAEAVDAALAYISSVA